MNNNIFFSIAIPAFKDKFFKECVDSILSQTYKNFELIIVNDNSPGKIEEIVYEYNDERITYFKNNKNIGAENVVDNWNICLSKAKGDYFILMGDDDKMEKDYLQEFVSLIQKYPNLDVYHCRTYIIDENSRKIELTTSWSEYESVYENMFHRLNFYRQQFISDFVYRTALLKARNGFFKLPLAWASDDLSAYIAMNKKGIAHTNKPIFNYRKNSLTISSRGSSKLKMKALLEEEIWLKEFYEKNIPETEIDKIIYLKLLIYINKYIKKRKISIVSESFKTNFFNSVLYWGRHLNRYNLKFIYMIHAFMLFFYKK